MSARRFLGDPTQYLLDLGLTGLAKQSPSSLAVTGGSINGTTIGATVAASGTFTNISTAAAQLTSASIYGGSINNTAIGAATPSTGAFTSLAASSSLTVTGTLTGNGQVYFTNAGNVNMPATINLFVAGAGTDTGRWDFTAGSNGSLAFRTVNDVYTTANTWMQVSRSGLTPTGIQTYVPLTLSSDPIINGGVLSPQIKAIHTTTGGGTIVFDTNSNFSWSNRFIVMNAGNSPLFSTTGYFDIFVPTSGSVITGYNGASSFTMTSAGNIPILAWQTLYYILPIGSSNPTINGNFALVGYGTGSFNVPANWLPLATRNGDFGKLHVLGGRYILAPGDSLDTTQFRTGIYTPGSYGVGGSISVGGAAGSILTANQLYVQGVGTLYLANAGSGNVVMSNASGSVSVLGSLAVNNGLTVTGSVSVGNNGGTSTNKLLLSGGANGSNTSDLNHYIYSTGSGGNTMFFGEYGGIYKFYNTATSVSDITFAAGNITMSGQLTASTVSASGNLYASGALVIANLVVNGNQVYMNSGALYLANSGPASVNLGNASTGLTAVLGQFQVSGTSAFTNTVAINASVSATPQLALNQNTTTWNTAAAFNSFRYIQTSYNGSDGFRQFAVGGGGVGIGYAPSVYGSGDALYVSGNVGIGTNAPTAMLHVAGNVLSTGTITSNSSTSFNAVGSSGGVGLLMGPNAAIRDNTNGGSTMFFDVSLGGTTNGQWIWRSSSNLYQRMVLDTNGVLSVGNNIVAAGIIQTSNGALTINSNQMWTQTGALYLQYSNATGGVNICSNGGTTTIGGPLTVSGASNGITVANSGVNVGANFLNGSLNYRIYNDGGGHIEHDQYLFINTNTNKDIYLGTGVLRAQGPIAASSTISASSISTTGGPSNISGVFVGGGQSAPNAQGTWIQWNYSVGTGATYIMNQKGGGSGGVNVGETTTAGAYTNAASFYTNSAYFAGSLTIGTGGNSNSGSIYSDANWGMYLVGLTNPAIAHFSFRAYNGTELVRIDTAQAFNVYGAITATGSIYPSNAVAGNYRLYNDGNGHIEVNTPLWLQGISANDVRICNGGGNTFIGSNGSYISGIGQHFCYTTGSQFLAPGYMLYSDGANMYILLTGNGANGQATQTYNGLRPFQINLSTGNVAMANGLSVSGGLTVSGSLSHAGVAKAWVIFNGNGGIISSYNVSSVTVNSTGYYTINLPSGILADANYAYSLGSSNPATNVMSNLQRAYNGTKTATAFQVEVLEVYSQPGGNAGYSSTPQNTGGDTNVELSVFFYHS